MEELKRLFVAVPIPLSIRDRLCDVGHHLKKRVQPPAKRWLFREDYHITLQFLGDVEQDKVSPISDCLEELAKQFTPFRIAMTQPILFPSKRHPTVIACPIRPNLILDRAATQVSKQMTQFEIPEIHLPYRGHVTLARIHHNNPPRIPFLGMEVIEMTATSIALFQSESEPDGDQHYRIVREFKF